MRLLDDGRLVREPEIVVRAEHQDVAHLPGLPILHRHARAGLTDDLAHDEVVVHQVREHRAKSAVLPSMVSQPSPRPTKSCSEKFSAFSWIVPVRRFQVRGQVASSRHVARSSG